MGEDVVLLDNETEETVGVDDEDDMARKQKGIFGYAQLLSHGLIADSARRPSVTPALNLRKCFSHTHMHTHCNR